MILNSFFYLFIFFFGLIVGSFLNSIIHRLSTKESVLFKRSYCPYCEHILNWQDLIPLFSFLILKRKCRYCSQKISWQYPLVELTTALLFLLIFNLQASVFNLQGLLFAIYYSLISCFLIVIFVYDLKHYIIPDKVIFPAIAVAFLYQLSQASSFKTLTNPLLSAILASSFFLFIVLISKGRWMGVGDIKLAFFMGLFLGFPNILAALFLAFFLGAIAGIFLIVLGKKTLKSEIPFAPFLVTGTFLAMFLGDKIIDFYLNLFLLK